MVIPAMAKPQTVTRDGIPRHNLHQVAAIRINQVAGFARRRRSLLRRIPGRRRATKLSPGRDIFVSEVPNGDKV